MLLTIIIK